MQVPKACALLSRSLKMMRDNNVTMSGLKQIMEARMPCEIVDPSASANANGKRNVPNKFEKKHATKMRKTRMLNRSLC